MITIFGARQNKAHLAFFARFRCSLWRPHPPASTLWHSTIVRNIRRLARQNSQISLLLLTLAAGIMDSIFKSGPKIGFSPAFEREYFVPDLARLRGSWAQLARPSAYERSRLLMGQIEELS